MDFVYKPLVQRFKTLSTLFDQDGVKPIAHFDRFKGQYLNPELHHPWPTPALFFKFNVIWEDSGANTQTGHATLELHLELENYGESYDGSPDQEYALEDYKYQAIVFAIAHGFRTAEFSPLRRRITEEDENPSNTNVTKIIFDFDVIDRTAERYNDWIKAALDDMEVKKEPLEDPEVPVVDEDDFTIL